MQIKTTMRHYFTSTILAKIIDSNNCWFRSEELESSYIGKELQNYAVALENNLAAP
jgi:hypothetical protein